MAAFHALLNIRWSRVLPISFPPEATPFAEGMLPKGTKRKAWHDDGDPADEACTKCGGTGTKRRRIMPDERPAWGIPDTSVWPFEEYTKGEIWDDDGDIVLIVGDTVFCVKRAVLLTHVGFFQDMFAMPQPPGETLDGKPFAHIQNVEPEDMVWALYFYIDRRELFLLYQDTYYGNLIKIDAALSLLRTGSKLDIPDMREFAVEGLCHWYPPTDCVDDDPRYDISPADEIAYDIPDWLCIYMVNMAREFEVPVLLPRALYYCAQLTIAQIFNGVERDDGKVVKLRQPDIQRVIEGREKLIFARRHTVLGFLQKFTKDGRTFSHWSGCKMEKQKGGDTCFGWLMRIHVDFNFSRAQETDAAALRPLDDSAYTLIREHLCSACQSTLGSEMHEGKEKVRQQLPLYFRLGPWSSINTCQDKADERYGVDLTKSPRLGFKRPEEKSLFRRG
ncbi:hypothetical protein PLICRDRAFT_172166 [Plicaturopsis crispa FD-325 SS-3]|nr:hypothetical protein PLICRDRAFT_172166 [Plicaturopsis crispa FD-325 SS-3]